jgi:TetR/AcrR family transcriptional regulator, transcriptional repressor for nem operon
MRPPIIVGSTSAQNLKAVQRRGPGSKADPSHPTFAQIMDAAIDVADQNGLGEMSVNDVTQHAGIAKGTFYVHFADRAALVLALHRKFHDELFAEVLVSTKDLPPGTPRARARIAAFLDGCRQLPGVRSLLLQARNHNDIRAEVERRNTEAARLIATDLRTGRRSGHEHQTAQLIVAATIEVARVELETNKRQPNLRKALSALVAPHV